MEPVPPEPIKKELDDLYKKITKLESEVDLDTLKPLLRESLEFFTNCKKEKLLEDPSLMFKSVEICHNITKHLARLTSSLLGINILCRAIEKIQETDNQLTAVHADLFQLCLLAKYLQPSLPFLDIDVRDINQHIDSEHFLLYFYYGGMIYTGLKNYDSALYLFEACIITVAPIFSRIMIEAFKKYILLCLILKGKYIPLRHYGSSMTKHVKKLSTQADVVNYKNIAAACEKGDTTQLEILIDKCSGGFHEDKNLGLVHQVRNSLYKRNIKNLANTFMTLSLSDVAARVNLPGPEVAEKYILNMIEDGEIFASINQEDGIVAFQDNPENYDCLKMLEKIEKEISQCAELGEKLRQMEELIVKSPKFVAMMYGISTNTDEDDNDHIVPRKFRTNAN